MSPSARFLDPRPHRLSALLMWALVAGSLLPRPAHATDVAPPTVTVGGVSEGATISQGTARLTWTGSDDQTPADSLRFNYTIDGGSAGSWARVRAVTLAHLPPGSHTVRVQAKDDAGNVSVEIARQFTVLALPSGPQGDLGWTGNTTPCTTQLPDIGSLHQPGFWGGQPPLPGHALFVTESAPGIPLPHRLTLGTAATRAAACAEDFVNFGGDATFRALRFGPGQWVLDGWVSGQLDAGVPYPNSFVSSTLTLSEELRVGPAGSSDWLTVYDVDLSTPGVAVGMDGQSGRAYLGSGANIHVTQFLQVGGGNAPSRGFLTIGSGAMLEKTACCDAGVGVGTGNTGDVSIDNGGVLRLGPGNHFVGRGGGTGYVSVNAGGQLQCLDPGSTWVIGGEPGSRGQMNVSGSWTSAGNVVVGDGGDGSLGVDYGGQVSCADLTIAAGAGQHASAYIAAGTSRLAVSGTCRIGVANDGKLDLYGGTLQAGLVVIEPGFGRLTGCGTIEGVVANEGRLGVSHWDVLSDRIDSTLVTGSFSQSATGSLRAMLGSRGGVGLASLLRVTQAAALDGDLVLDPEYGFLPQVGQQFVVLRAASVAGQFAHIVSNVGTFAVAYLPDRVVLTCLALPPGTPRLDTVESIDGGAAVRVRWTLPATGGAACAVEITRSTAGELGLFTTLVPADCAAPLLPATATEYVDHAVSAPSGYAYRIRLLGPAGYSQPSGIKQTFLPTDIHWTNTSGGTWETAANWDLGRVPNADDRVFITAPGSYTVTLGSPEGVVSIELGGPGSTPTLRVLSGGLLSACTCSDSWVVNPGATVEMAGGATGAHCSPCPCTGVSIPCFSGSDSLTLRGTTVFQNAVCSGTLINRGTLIVRGNSTAEQLRNEAGAQLSVEGNATQGPAEFNVSYGLVNSGTLTLSSSGGAFGAALSASGLQNAVGASITSLPGTAGPRQLRVSPPIFAPGKSGALKPQATASFGLANAGTLNLQAATSLVGFETNSGLLSCSAPVTIDNSTSFFWTVSNTGEVRFAPGGSLAVLGSGLQNDGLLRGPGSVSFVGAPMSEPLSGIGTFAPASAGTNAPGTLALQGPLTLGGSTHVAVRIGGTTPGSGHDQLVVSQGMNLSGALDVTLAPGYVPPAGAKFTVMRGSPRTNQFASITGLALPQGGQFTVVYGDTSVTLQVPASADVPGATPRAWLHFDEARPRPAAGLVRLGFGIAEAGRVRLDVYDASGRRVRTLLEGTLPAAEREAFWDGTDDEGRRVKPGTYFARLDAGGRTFHTKVVLLR